MSLAMQPGAQSETSHGVLLPYVLYASPTAAAPTSDAAAAALAARHVNVIGHATRASIRNQVLSHGILLPYDLYASPTAAAPSSAAVAAAAAALVMRPRAHVVWEARWRRWGELHWAAPPASRRLP